MIYFKILYLFRLSTHIFKLKIQRRTFLMQIPMYKHEYRANNDAVFFIILWTLKVSTGRLFDIF